jgi:hypothetical protein
LSRGLADHIDEFRLIRHGWLPGVYPRKPPLCALPVNEAFPKRLAI